MRHKNKSKQGALEASSLTAKEHAAREDKIALIQQKLETAERELKNQRWFIAITLFALAACCWICITSTSKMNHKGVPFIEPQQEMTKLQLTLYIKFLEENFILLHNRLVYFAIAIIFILSGILWKHRITDTGTQVDGSQERLWWTVNLWQPLLQSCVPIISGFFADMIGMLRNIVRGE